MGQFNILKTPKRSCRTCGYEWFLSAEVKRTRGKTGEGKGTIIRVKITNPKNCPNPKCKSPYWDKPYTLGVKA